jgi:hypothetical protein
MNASRLRFALLTSLGVVPLSCGAATRGETTSNCSSPQQDPQTGLITCHEGYKHRPTAVTCVGPAGAEQSTRPRATGAKACEVDPNVCAAFQYGYCAADPVVGPFCLSGCATDLDCGGASICLCSGTDSWGTCVSATCRTDADCTPGYRCASYTSGARTSYACQTPFDSCHADQDCQPGQWCEAQVDGGRVCGPLVVSGRPFLVAQQARVAPVVQRSDWLLI